MNVIIVDNSMCYQKLFEKIGNTRSYVVPTDIESADLVVFTGGYDVHPLFYGGVDDGMSASLLERDEQEKDIFDMCLKYEVKMTGICRGFQFLNVMCGGYMHQHITNHLGYHDIALLNRHINVNSTHHQMVGLPSNAIPIGWATPSISDMYIGPDSVIVDYDGNEIEAAVFPHYNTMGVQYHPESLYENEPGKVYYEAIIRNFVKHSMQDFLNHYEIGVKNEFIMHD